MPKPQPDDVGLPSMDDFRDIVVPEFPLTFKKMQPGAIAKGGRIFSAGGAAGTRILKVIFADAELTRPQIAKITGASLARVGEVIWVLDNAVRRGQLESYPRLPTRRKKINDGEVRTDS